MILISHRGNLSGKSSEENNPNRIIDVINLGFDVEIDLRYTNNKYYLGHDFPEFEISNKWLIENNRNLWVHCKDIKTIEHVSNDKALSNLNYFYHEEDPSTITSKGFLWVYPGLQPVKNSIAVLPELSNDNTDICRGICSDYISKYKK